MTKIYVVLLLDVFFNKIIKCKMWCMFLNCFIKLRKLDVFSLGVLALFLLKRFLAPWDILIMPE